MTKNLRQFLLASLMACQLPAILSADEVKLAWNANPEPDIAGYLVHYGTESGNLTEFHYTGNVTTTTLADLEPSTTYYFAVQAYNTSGLFSELCDEISHRTSAPPPTGLVIRDQSGNTLSMDGGLLDFGIARLGAIGDERRFTLTNHGTETVNGLRWFLDDGGAENFILQGMPLVALVNSNGSFEGTLDGWSASGQVRSKNNNSATHGTHVAEFSFGDGPNDGSLIQAFATVPGRQYTLEFDLGIRSFNFNPQSMRTTVRGNETLMTDATSVEGTGSGETAWEAKSFEFTADSPLTTLLFEDVSGISTATDLILDHVRVIDPVTSSTVGGISLGPGKSIAFTLRFKPTKAGVRRARLWLMQDGETPDGYGFDVRGSGSVPFEEWLATPDVGASNGPLKPLQKFAFGIGPENAAGKALAFANGEISSRGTPAVIPPTGQGAAFQAVFGRKKDRDITGLVYRPQFSTDLIHWHDAPDQAVIVADDGEIEAASVSAPDEIDGKPVRFFRVGVEQVAPPSSHDFVKWLAHHEAADVSPGNAGKQQLTAMLMEYAFGLRPGSGPVGAASEIAGLVASRGNPDVRPPAAPDEAFKGIFGRRKNHVEAGLQYRPQFSADLIHWHDAPAAPDVLADDGEIQVLSVAAPAELDGLPARFFRVGVSGPMPEPPEPLGFEQWLSDYAVEESTAHHLMSYAFGLSTGPPAAGGLLEVNGGAISRGLPNVIRSADTQQPFRGIFGRREAHAELGLSYRPQFSADLVHWDDATTQPLVLARDGEIEVVSVSAPDEINGKPARFFRVGILLLPDP